MSLAAVACAGSAGTSANGPAQAAPSLVIAEFESGLAGVRAAGPGIKLDAVEDAAFPGQRVLSVEYPTPGDNPAARDVWCDAKSSDWSGGQAIEFRVKAEQALELSVSFMDRHHVAYTGWAEVAPGAWQPVSLRFDQIQPNPYFQPPDAKQGAALDLSNVKAIGFSPQGDSAGRFSISRLIVTRR